MAVHHGTIHGLLQGVTYGGPLSLSMGEPSGSPERALHPSVVGNQAASKKHLSDAPITPHVSLHAVVAVTPVELAKPPVHVPWTVRAIAPWLIGLAAVGAAAEALHLLTR